MSIETKNRSHQSPEIDLDKLAVHRITPDELPQVKNLFEKNTEYFGKGGIYADGLYQMVSSEVESSKESPNKRMGVWYKDALVGYVSIAPIGDHKVEIAYAVDQDHAGKGIVSSVIEEVTKAENEAGNDVVAEVERYNTSSARILGKLGFELTGYDFTEGRNLYLHMAPTEESLLRRLDR